MSLMGMLKNNLSKTKSHKDNDPVTDDYSTVVADDAVKTVDQLDNETNVKQTQSQSAMTEVAAPEVNKIETIPLSEEEITNLQKNGYNRAKQICTKTFILEKTFVGYADSKDPTNPGRKQVKMKRVAELKASSLMHALNLIGWDKKNVVLVSEIDEFYGQIQVQDNGKAVGTVTLPDKFVNFEKLSGGQQNVARKEITNFVVSEDSIKSYLSHHSKEVVKSVYVPRRRINLVTKKVSKQKCCTCDDNCKCSCVNVG